jgi:ribosomal protein S18 acetylase RimI-like enzyme
MLHSKLVSTREELVQIHELNQKNLKANFNYETQVKEGFVSWLYPLPLLEKMHNLAPGVIVKENDTVAGYALTTLKEARTFHPDLDAMFGHLQNVQYRGKFLSSFHFYCMGQICVAKEYRRKGVVQMLYQKHKEAYSAEYEFILTEISSGNLPSLLAHQKAGFEIIHSYTDSIDEWKVVVWDWK